MPTALSITTRPWPERIRRTGRPARSAAAVMAVAVCWVGGCCTGPGPRELCVPERLDRGLTVILPGIFGYDPNYPCITKGLHDAGVPMAVATDCNPGTSPLCSLQVAMWMATRVFGLTPAECLAGVTREAARALGLDDRGVLESGKRADIAEWTLGHPRELAYWHGGNPLSDLLIAGQSASPIL